MPKSKLSLRLSSIGILVLVVLVAVVIFSSYTIVGPGQRGIVVFLGSVEVDNVLPEGFHLVVPPMARQVIPIDVRTKKLEMVVEAASRDMQIMDVTGVLNYHLNPNEVAMLYRRVGLDFENIIIAPAMHEAIKAATSSYRVEDVLVLRAELKERIQSDLTLRLAEMHISVDQFSLANVEFSNEFNQAIERKQIAEQAARQKDYELQSAQKDIEIAVARAEAEKESAIKAAEGAARARELQAEAEAAALALIGEQLRRNPSLIQYEWASRLAPGVRTVFLPADQSIILDAQPLLEPDRAAQPLP